LLLLGLLLLLLSGFCSSTRTGAIFTSSNTRLLRLQCYCPVLQHMLLLLLL
jgi:hypothetical protein